MSTASTSGRPKRGRDAEEVSEPEDIVAKKTRTNGGDSSDEEEKPRWKAHAQAEEYIVFASNFMLKPMDDLGPYGYDADKRQYPLDGISALGFLKSPLRRPTVLETWSPLEIALFEGAIALEGKNFHAIQKEIKTKSTKEVIDFYYIWKKTAHYKVWKKTYVPPELDLSPEETAARKGKK